MQYAVAFTIYIFNFYSSVRQNINKTKQNKHLSKLNYAVSELMVKMSEYATCEKNGTEQIIRINITFKKS